MKEPTQHPPAGDHRKGHSPDRFHQHLVKKKPAALFTSIRHRPEVAATQVTLHVGPANSGKTFDAIETLKRSGSGIYLAPLRLLAWEVADKLNQQGHPCSLVTGEEKVVIPNAPYVAATVEMFSLDYRGDCIVLDESQMIADEQRGWAWMRVLANAQARAIEIIASPDAERLLTAILDKVGYSHRVARHHRLAPLTVATAPWRIDQPSPSTIFVVFSRAGVLSLKTFLERKGWSVAAIYGNLPPEVKKKQAERFLSGDAQLCVATDAIGMGMNLPASRVCFTDISKYDGKEQRLLTPAEARQIAGRAGRYGIKEFGEVGALQHDHVRTLRKILGTEPPDLSFARVSPELSDIEKMEGPLAQRLAEWERHQAIPEDLKHVLLPADLEHQKALAAFLRDGEVQKLGLPVVFTLIKAPASRDSIGYWVQCVKNIMEAAPLPLPASLRQINIENEDMLLSAEQAVEQCDIYLWIGHREGLQSCAPHKDQVLEYKWRLIDQIDRTLAVKLDMRQKCSRCNKVLPLLHRYGTCESCYRRGTKRFFAQPNRRKRFRYW